MAGHRAKHDRAKRGTSRADRMESRVLDAPTAESQLSAAFDWFRSAARRRPGGTDAMREAASWLYEAARRLEGRTRA